MSDVLIKPLPTAIDPMAALRAVSDLPFPLLLESAARGPGTGRCSFLTADPIETDIRDAVSFGEDPFAIAREWTNRIRAESVADVAGFSGGVAGLLGYELGHAFERLPQASASDWKIPVIAIGLFDWVLAWDHETNECRLVARDFGGRSRSLEPRAEELIARFCDRHPAAVRQEPCPRTICESNFTRESYIAAVEQVIEYIRAGDIFQANLSQQLSFAWNDSPIECYARLRERNPAPMAACFAGPDWAVISASPERFLQLSNRRVETRPIKGTRRRAAVPEADLFTGDALRESEKDRAENVMIVDLLRNDLSRVCRPGSVKVPELCKLETYETVQHLVSTVHGELSDGNDWWDLLAATFPGGSITGAPKVRAMEIITELEQVSRGPYCGSLFYHSADGTCDSSILIRTLTCQNDHICCPVGGGIVADSDPQTEFEETLDKAAGMLRVLE